MRIQRQGTWNALTSYHSSGYVLCSPSTWKPLLISTIQSLRGVFEVRIYSEQHSIRNIRQLVTSKDWDSRSAYGVDLVKLNKVLNSVNYAAVRQRRATYSRLYHEATISHHSGRGITFTEMLLLLAHHKLIVDKEALV